MICLKNRTFAVSQTSVHQKLVCCFLLWFAWKIVLLQYHKHRVVITSVYEVGCDLLEKSYFCSITNINWGKRKINKDVVICLKNRTFAVSQTSWLAAPPLSHRLWFAWKIVLLQYHKHLPIIGFREPRCCDLLEKSYFCSITNITKSYDLHKVPVVICLKNRTFAVSQTSHSAVRVRK